MTFDPEQTHKILEGRTARAINYFPSGLLSLGMKTSPLDDARAERAAHARTIVTEYLGEVGQTSSSLEDLGADVLFFPGT